MSKIGKKFGKLIILEDSNKKDKHHNRIWSCLCECGNFVLLPNCNIVGGVKSCGCSRGLPDNEGLIRDLYRHYRKNAIKRNIIFNLSLKNFKDFINKRCTYCNRKPYIEYKRISLKGKLMYNGLDRVDNAKGYTKRNITSCCKECNYLKSDKFSYEEVKIMVKALTKYRKSKGLI